MSDANDFFSTTEVNARLDLVRHLIENSELVPLVRGPSGVGKTLLASRLQQLAPDNWAVCHFEADPTMQPERLLATIARCSGLPDIAGELLQRLVDRYEVLRKRGRIPVLLVDDAQMLPPTSLITLLRLFEKQLNGVRLVSIVLFADEQIDLLLSTPQLQVMSPQAIQVIDLPVLTRQEAAAFMKFLLINEGLSEKLALDEVKLNRIYRETKGLPGPLAAAILNAVGEDRVEDKSASLFTGYRKQLLIGGLPLLLVLSLFMWMISSLMEPESEVIPERRVEREIAPFPAPAAHTQPEAPMPELAQTDMPMQSLPKEQNLGEAIQAPETPVSQVTEITIESSGAPVDTASVETAPDPEPETTAPTASSQVVEESPPSGNRTGTPANLQASPEATTSNEGDTAVEPLVEAGSQDLPELNQPVEADSQDLPELNQPVEADSQDLPELNQPVEPAKPLEKQAGDAAAEWVMTRSPSHYTLQLIAVENLDSLKRYVATSGLGGEAYTFRMTRNGKPWYALLWGDFPDRTSAQKGVTRLPAKVQKAGVWPRTFASVQQSKRQ